VPVVVRNLKPPKRKDMHPLYWLNQVHSAAVQLAICPSLNGSLLDGVTPVIRCDKHAVEIRFTTTLGEGQEIKISLA
jgi:hypothetical protein